MTPIAIIIPSLRKERWEAVRKNAEDNTPDGKVYFGGEEYSSYAEAVNALFKKTKEPYIFVGADDLDFHPGWSEKALELMERGYEVVGVNDLHHPDVLAGTHATHYLIDREYINEKGGTFEEIPGKVLHEYNHNFVDTEFVETARCRGAYAHSFESIVEHKHHAWGGNKKDDVYEKSNKTFMEDLRTYQTRRLQWLDKYGPPDDL